jgi:hypothetical protein
VAAGLLSGRRAFWPAGFLDDGLALLAFWPAGFLAGGLSGRRAFWMTGLLNSDAIAMAGLKYKSLRWVF